MALNEPSIRPLLEATAGQGYQMALNVACFGAMAGTIPPWVKAGGLSGLKGGMKGGWRLGRWWI